MTAQIPPQIPPHWLRDEALSPADVARTFGVDARTVTKWAKNAVLGYFRTPQGIRRYPICEVHRLMAGDPPEDQQLLIDLVAEDARRQKEKRPHLYGYKVGEKRRPVADGSAE